MVARPLKDPARRPRSSSRRGWARAARVSTLHPFGGHGEIGEGAGDLSPEHGRKAGEEEESEAPPEIQIHRAEVKAWSRTT